MEAFSLLEKANMLLQGWKVGEAEKAVKVLKTVVRDFPSAQMKAAVEELSTRHNHRILTGPDEARKEEQNAVLIDLNRLAVSVTDTKLQIRVQNNEFMIICMQKAGRYKEALKVALLAGGGKPDKDPESQFSPFQRMLQAAIECGREDLFPDITLYKRMVIENFGIDRKLLPALVVKGLCREYISLQDDYGNWKKGWGWLIQGTILVLQSFLVLEDMEGANKWLDKNIMPLKDSDSVLRMLVVNGDGDLFPGISGKFKNNDSEIVRNTLKYFRVSNKIYAGDLAGAGKDPEALQPEGKEAVIDFPENMGLAVFQAMLFSLGYLGKNKYEEKKVEHNVRILLCGPYLNLAEFFLGRSKLKMEKWPVPYAAPQLYLWLALWYEAKGKKAEAISAVKMMMDERLGEAGLQRQGKMLIKRIESKG